MSNTGGETQYVTLGLGDEVFAAPVGVVQEILEYRKPFGIPEGPAYLLGLTDVRGRGVPTIDLRTKLGLSPVEVTPATRILVVDVPLEDRVLSLGLVADRVIEVATYRNDQIEQAPDIGVPWKSEYIQGVVKSQSGFVVIFNLGLLLSTKEAASLVQTDTVEAAA